MNLKRMILCLLFALHASTAFAQTPTKTVRSVYVVPSDASNTNRQALVYSALLENQQLWASYGATFVAEPIETLVSTHDSNWFIQNPDGLHNSTDWNWLGNSVNEIIAHTDLEFNDPDHRVVIFLEVDVTGFCPCAAAANFGYAGMPKWIIDRIEQGFAPEVGSIGHELGHTFGMPHEDCAAQCEPRGVMCNGQSLDACNQLTSYPDVQLTDWHFNYLFQPQFQDYFVEFSCAPPISASRDGGLNLPVYFATPPIMGATVYFNAIATYTSGVMIAYSQPANLNLANGQVLLVDLGSSFLFSKSLAGLPFGHASQDVPMNFALCGAQAYTQVILFGPTDGGPPFQLTNAQDLTVGR